MELHRIDQRLLQGQVNVALVGCGGSGSQALTALARLHLSLLALGHPVGLKVAAFDPDVVSTSNIGRQLFGPSDVGINKACCLVHRLNMFYGLDWRAVPELFSKENNYYDQWDIVIGCVDTKKSRRGIIEVLSGRTCYYLDLGNGSHYGQVLLGQTGREKGRLPHALEVFPELAEKKENKTVPSCSLAESLRSQSLFINQAVVTHGMSILYNLFTIGHISHHGVFINLQTGRVRPIAVPKPVS